MVSSRSLKPLIWALNIGYFFRAIPVTGDPINFCLIFKCGQTYRIPFFQLRTPRSGYMWAGIYFAIQVLSDLYLVIFLLFLEHSNLDFYIASFLLTCSLFATLAQLLFLFFNLEELVNAVNAVLFLDLKIRKFRKR